MEFSELFEIFPILRARLVILGVEIPAKDLGVFECVFSGLSKTPGPIDISSGYESCGVHKNTKRC